MAPKAVQTGVHFHLHVPRHADDGITFTWLRSIRRWRVLEGYALQLRNAMHAQEQAAA